MKTISAIAIEKIPDAFDPDEILPARAQHLVNIERRGFIDGARYMSKELLRWRDPKKELPEEGEDVLIKTTMCRKYCVAFYRGNNYQNYRWHENNGAIDDDMVIGWRPIQEE